MMMSVESVGFPLMAVAQTVKSLATTVRFLQDNVNTFFTCMSAGFWLLRVVGIVLKSGSIHLIQRRSVLWIGSRGVVLSWVQLLI